MGEIFCILKFIFYANFMIFCIYYQEHWNKLHQCHFIEHVIVIDEIFYTIKDIFLINKPLQTRVIVSEQ